MDIYKNDGTTNINFDIIEANKSKLEGDRKEKNNNIIDYSFVYLDSPGTYISSDIELKNNIYKIANNFYLGICVTGNVLHLVTETGEYYIIYTDKVSFSDIKFIFNNESIKKVYFDSKDINSNVFANSIGTVDLKFISKVLFLKDFNSEKEMFSYFGIPEQKVKTISVKAYNFIEIAKKINIYVEKNKVNRYLYLEEDVKRILDESSRSGFPIDEGKYDEYVGKLYEDYGSIKNYNLDFSNKTKILEYLNKENKYLSLYPEILKSEDNELYKKLAIFNSFNLYKKNNHMQRKDKFIYIKYDTYNVNTLGIKESFAPDCFYYVNEGFNIVEGIYKDIYYKILAELSRDENLILEASQGTFLDYIGEKVEILKKAEDKNSKIIISMFLNAYANRIYDEMGITNYLYHRWNTYVSNDDVKNMNKLFYEKMPSLMNFFKLFDGNKDEYSRYNSKIFHPGLNLHQCILQIENLVYKTSISYIHKAIEDYNEKYKKDAILIGGVFNKKIVLLAMNEHSDIAVDILNRYMAEAYRRYIKRTKYLNATEVNRK